MSEPDLRVTLLSSRKERSNEGGGRGGREGGRGGKECLTLRRGCGRSLFMPLPQPPITRPLYRQYRPRGRDLACLSLTSLASGPGHTPRLLISVPGWRAGFLCGREGGGSGCERRGKGRKVAANHRARLFPSMRTITNTPVQNEHACGKMTSTNTHRVVMK